MLKYSYVIFKSRDALFASPTFDFHFKITLPKARKERIILERDMLGRILTSRVPEMPYNHAEK